MSSGSLIGVLQARVVTGSGGGVERVILNCASHIQGSAYRTLAFYIHPPGDPGFKVIQARAQAINLPVVDIGERFQISLPTIRRIIQVCRDQKIQIWHSHDYKSNALGVLLRPILKFRTVTTVHGWVKQTPRTRVYYALDRWMLKRFDRVVAVSQDLYQSCRRIGVDGDRLHLIENGIDTDTFRRAGPAGMAPGRDLPPGRLLIGGVGRLSPEKGFDLLIEAVSVLIREGLDLELWIAGGGPEQDRLAARAAATGHGDRIRLIGYQTDMLGLMERLDIFCLSSLREGLPLAMLEAMAMEVPVVATRSGGVGAFGHDGDDMLLVPCGSTAALIQALRRVALDPDLRGRLSATGRRRVETDCSVRRTMARLVDVYDGLGVVPM